MEIVAAVLTGITAVSLFMMFKRQDFDSIVGFLMVLIADLLIAVGILVNQ